MTTKIEWVVNQDGTKGKTWNPITGCTKISPGCRNCYAARMAKRLAGRAGYPEAPHEFDVILHPDKLDQPLRQKKPTVIFPCSMGDLFHENVPDEWIDRIWATMLLCPQHTFQVLTKRIKRAHRYLSGDERDPDFPGTSLRYRKVLDAACAIRGKRPELLDVGISDPVFAPARHIWLGVTAEDQARADERIPLLLQTPAAVRFVSVEPMLSAIDLEPWLMRCDDCGNSGSAAYSRDRLCESACIKRGEGPALDWVICGGETGPGARPIRPEWVRGLRDQCVAAGVPFFFKKWGGPQGQGWVHDGKLYSGHLLDGREWSQMPAILKAKA